MEIKKLPKSEIEIRTSILWESWKFYIDKAVETLGKDIKVSGFRPGKAPRNIVEKQVGTRAIFNEAARGAVQKSYADILKKEKIEAVGAPRVEILKIAEGNDLEYKATTAVMPKIRIEKWEGEIKKINKKYKGGEIKVEDKEIDHELENLANSRVKLVTVNREARSGNSVVIDFQIKRDGVPIENGTAKNHPLVLGKGVFIPGFEGNIIGMKEHGEKEFDLTFPENYHDKNLAGKPATFNVKVNLVQERQVPEINDEFAKSLGKFEKLSELKESVNDGIRMNKEKSKAEKMRTEIIDKLVEKSEVDLPEVLVHGELHKMIQEFSVQIEGMGMKLDDYLSKMGKTLENLEKDWQPQAEKRLKSALILEQIAKDREIEIPSEKIEEEMNKTLQYYKNVKNLEKNIEMDKLYNYVKGVLMNEETFKWLESL